MFKKILLAADGSKHSREACKKLLYLAKKIPTSSITVIHVIDDLPVLNEAVLEDKHVYDSSISNSTQLETIEDMFEKANITYKIQYMYGEPGKTIVLEANEGLYDLVVIGSRGFNQLQQMVLGSVSHKVAKRALCPVLIVKINEDNKNTESQEVQHETSY